MKKFDLQFFATQTTGTTDLSAEMKTFYNTTLLDSAKANLVHQQFGKKVGLPKNHGKTIEWRKWNSIGKATTALTEGTTPSDTALKVTSITAEVKQYGAYSIISDLLDFTAVDNVIVEASEKHGESAGLTIDTVTRDALFTDTDVTTIFSSTDTVSPAKRANLTADCKLTVTDIAKAVATLKKNNAPKIDGKYVGIIHPSVEFDIVTSEDWKDVHKYDATTEIFEGEIGEIYGVRFVESTEAKIYKGGSTEPSGLAVYSTLILGKDAYGVVDLEGGGIEMIIKQLGEGEDPLNQRATVGWKTAGYAAKVLQPDYMVNIESCSSFSATDVAN